ncbi:MAG TPA: hypothetical protein VMU32_12715 [Solirubrobacteraceae bacterium]|nr:hypothetical protein [Solirubrobacteraceae bacterium]
MAHALLLGGAAVLFLGATAALVAPHLEFGNSEWQRQTEATSQVLAYIGALSAFVGVLIERSSPLAIILATAVPVLICLALILVASWLLRRRALPQDDGVRDAPKANDDRPEPVAAGQHRDRTETDQPEGHAPNGRVPERETSKA